MVALDEQIRVWHEKSPQAEVLTSIPGIGPLIGAAIAATVPGHRVFRSGRDFAAWLRLV